MTQVEWLRSQKKRIQQAAEKLSHNTMSSALTQEQYLQNVGAYRAYRVIVQNFDALIEKIMGGDDQEEETPTAMRRAARNDVGLSDMDDDDDDDQPPVPRGKQVPRARPRQPREWGG